MPNVMHTPNIFLPNNDRRKLKASSTDALLPPSMYEPREKRYHVTDTDMAEIRALRVQDPTLWSVKKLAKKFDCAPLFVTWVVDGLVTDKKKMQEAITAAVKSRWSKNKRIAREDRELRKEIWRRDA